MGISVTKGDPSNIRCYGNADVKAIVSSCETILNSMVVDTQQQTFGVEAGSSVPLPWTQQAGENSIPTSRTDLHLRAANM